MGTGSKTTDQYIKSLFKAGAVKVAKDEYSLFRLKSGKKSWLYIDHGDVICQPETYLPFIEVLKELIKKTFSLERLILINTPAKASPQVVGALAKDLTCRQIAITPDATALAEQATYRTVRLPHTIGEDDVFVIVDDVMTSGKTNILVAEQVKALLHDQHIDGPEQYHVIIGVNKYPLESQPRLEKAGINAHWVTTVDHILILGWDRFTHEQQQGLLNEFPDVKKLLS